MRNAVRHFVPLAQREKPVTLTCSGNVETTVLSSANAMAPLIA